eukprot:12213552-Heterocapsa_arctica.AAC.1
MVAEKQECASMASIARTAREEGDEGARVEGGAEDVSRLKLNKDNQDDIVRLELERSPATVGW